MYNGVEIIHADPPGMSLTFYMGRIEVEFVLDSAVHIFGHRFDLSIGIAFTDDEKICRGVFQVSQVEFDNIFAFDVLKAIYDEIVQCFLCRNRNLDFCWCTQNEKSLVL